jgi:hypothetical protein
MVGRLAISHEHRSGRGLPWGAIALLVLGLGVEYYAHAMGALLSSSCASFAWEAPGRCGSPLRWSLLGILFLALGCAGTLFWLFRRVTGRRTRPDDT